MDGKSVGLSGFPLSTPHPRGRMLRGAAIAFFLAAGGLIAAAPSDAAVVAPSRDAFAGAPITLVRDYCGHGYHRVNKQRTKWGSWVGKCVPNRPKKQ
jgi:hypothetical protein